MNPTTSSWKTLCPSFLDSRRIHLEDDTTEHVIGSPPPTKSFWSDSAFASEVPNFEMRNGDGEVFKCTDGASYSQKDTTKVNLETSELSLRVQEMYLQQQQPMIICENVDDEKHDGSEHMCNDEDALTLAVPPVDVSDEKKRPPLNQ